MAPNNTTKEDNNDKPLRQLAAEKLHGKDANPTLLGDPVSLKAETNDSNPSPRGESQESLDFPKTTRPIPESSDRTAVGGKRGGGDATRAEQGKGKGSKL
ncbi:hypothetical protein QBC43DRAFT_296329 [Cladorrhinum sp. PSN259]|nr:hypothetical protein QBC43DRAFT_296329 [Cladorrhinum sp. PSN259]